MHDEISLVQLKIVKENPGLYPMLGKIEPQSYSISNDSVLPLSKDWIPLAPLKKISLLEICDRDDLPSFVQFIDQMRKQVLCGHSTSTSLLKDISFEILISSFDHNIYFRF